MELIKGGVAVSPGISLRLQAVTHRSAQGDEPMRQSLGARPAQHWQSFFWHRAPSGRHCVKFK